MTEYKRFELLDGVYLTAVRTDTCAQSCLSMTFLTQLTRETAALNAALMPVLRRGSSRLADADAIDAALVTMDATIEPTVRKLGELQAVGLKALFRPDAFAQMARELTAMLLAPNTRGGLLRPDWVKEAAAALAARQEADRADTAQFARRRLIEEMCCCEDFALSPLGDSEGAESIHYQKLTRHYHSLVQESPLEIFYCGTVAPRDAAHTLAELLSGMPRGELNEELGTDVRMNSLEAEPRIVTESAPGLSETRLAVGWRLGDQMEDPDLAALRVLAASLEQALRKTLDGAAQVTFDMHKGLLTLDTPLRTSLETARGVIDAQLGLMQAGALAPEALSDALDALDAELLDTTRDASRLESYWTERATLGLIYSPEELTGLLHEVTAQDVAEAARGPECDMIYVCAPEADEEQDTSEA